MDTSEKRRKVEWNAEEDEDFYFLPFVEEESEQEAANTLTDEIDPSQLIGLPSDILRVVFGFLDETVITRMRVASSALASLVFPNLLSIDFSRWPNLDTAEIESVTRKCPNLHEVALGDAVDVNQRVKILTCLTGLQSLSLSSCPSFDPEGMEFVTRTFTGLRSLNIHRCARLQSPNVCLISRLTSLTSLNVGQVPRVDDGVMQIVKDLTALRSLSIGRCKKMTPEGLMHLQHLTGLTKLDLTGVAVITDEILQTICQRSSSIQVLRLGRCTQRLTDKGFEAVGTLRALVELDLRATRITSAGTSHFTSLTGLQILDLKRCPAIQQATFEHIAVLTNLRILNISKCMLLTAPHTTEFWDETLSAILPGMTCLETLDLSHNRLLNGGFISSIPPSVTELSLEGLLLDDDIVPVSDVWALSRLVNLTRLDFSHTADNIATYAKSLHSLARLEYLFFAHSMLDDSSTAFLSQLTSLRFLDLSHSPFVMDQTIARLSTLTNLRTLLLVGIPPTQITPVSIRALASVTVSH